LFLGARGDDDVGARLGQCFGRRCADAAASAGDDGDAVINAESVGDHNLTECQISESAGRRGARTGWNTRYSSSASEVAAPSDRGGGSLVTWAATGGTNFGKLRNTYLTFGVIAAAMEQCATKQYVGEDAAGHA
jgi:hypothetical protein